VCSSDRGAFVWCKCAQTSQTTAPLLCSLAIHHPAAGALSTDDAVSAALETVLYSQMLVLFAPQAVPAKSHLPVLVGWVWGGQGRQVGMCPVTQLQHAWALVLVRFAREPGMRIPHLETHHHFALQQPAVEAAAAAQGGSRHSAPPGRARSAGALRKGSVFWCSHCIAAPWFPHFLLPFFFLSVGSWSSSS